MGGGRGRGEGYGGGGVWEGGREIYTEGVGWALWSCGVGTGGEGLDKKGGGATIETHENARNAPGAKVV